MQFNSKKQIPQSIQVLRNSIVTVIADCNKRVLRWEVDAHPYSLTVKFEDISPNCPINASFRFAVGGSNGGVTQIVRELEHALRFLRENGTRSQMEKVLLFLQDAHSTVQVSTDQDCVFHFQGDRTDSCIK